MAMAGPCCAMAQRGRGGLVSGPQLLIVAARYMLWCMGVLFTPAHPVLELSPMSHNTPHKPFVRKVFLHKRVKHVGVFSRSDWPKCVPEK